MVFLFGWLIFPFAKLDLVVYGIILFAITLFNIIVPFIIPSLEKITQSLTTGVTVVLIVLGFTVSKLAIKNYLKNGWEFSDPQSDEVKRIKEKWKIS